MLTTFLSLTFLYFFFFSSFFLSAMPWVYGYRLQALLQMLRSRKGKDRRQFFTLVASARKTWKDEVILSFPLCLLVTYSCLCDNPANNCLQSINTINSVHNITIPSSFSWHKNQELCCKILAWTEKKKKRTISFVAQGQQSINTWNTKTGSPNFILECQLGTQQRDN